MKNQYQFIVQDIKGDQHPRIIYRSNSEGRGVFCFSEWDTVESEEGWTRSEIKSMIDTLTYALNESESINTQESTRFLFNPIRDL
jgi:hypothetical protein